MKRYLMVFLCLTLSSCDKETKEDSIPLNASKILGTWQVVSESYSVGGPLITVEVENGGVYTFRLDGTFTFKVTEDPSLNFLGAFDLEENILSLNYSRDGEEIFRGLQISFEKDTITWFPVAPAICIEGCSTTLKKIE